MSEAYRDFPVVDFDLDAIDDIMIDPPIRSLLRKVERLNTGEPHMAYDDAHALVVDLDQEFGSDQMHSPCTFTARVSYFESSGENGHIVNRMMVDASAIAKGFTAVPRNEEAYLSDVDEEPSWKIVMLFDAQDDAGSVLPVTVDPVDMQALAFEYSISVEQSRALLGYYVPDILSRLDECVTDRTDEAQAVLDTYDLIYDLDRGGYDHVRVARALNVYAGESLSFDAQMPYVISAATDAYVMSDEGAQASRVTLTNGLVQIDRLHFLEPVEDDGTSSTVVPFVRCTILNTLKEGDHPTILLPTVGITELKPLRQLYFEQDTEEQQ